MPEVHACAYVKASEVLTQDELDAIEASEISWGSHFQLTLMDPADFFGDQWDSHRLPPRMLVLLEG